MFQGFSRGWALGNETWKTLNNNRQLLIYPLISGIALTIVTIVFMLPMLATGFLQSLAERNNQPSGAASIAAFIVSFLFYLVSYFVIIFSNTALVGAVMMKAKGEKENPTAADGFKIAQERIPQILGFAFLSAIVGMIANAIRDTGRESKNIVLSIIASLIAGTILAVWSYATFMVIPVYVVEGVGLGQSLSRSWDLLKKTWGEQVGGGFSIGLIGCVATLALFAVVLVVGGIGAATHSIVLLVLAGIILFAGFGFISVLNGAMRGILMASVYQYATTGSGGLMDTSVVQGAFYTKTKRR